MSTPNDGGPAFPTDGVPDKLMSAPGAISMQGIPASSGMSLRDYFAAKALTGNLAADAEQTASARQHAEWAFEQADAMLAARSRERK